MLTLILALTILSQPPRPSVTPEYGIHKIHDLVSVTSFANI